MRPEGQRDRQPVAVAELVQPAAALLEEAGPAPVDLAEFPPGEVRFEVAVFDLAVEGQMGSYRPLLDGERVEEVVPDRGPDPNPVPDSVLAALERFRHRNRPPRHRQLSFAGLF